MHAAAAKAGGFARRIEPGHRLGYLVQHARRQIRHQPAQRFPCQDVEPDGDQRPVGWVEDAVNKVEGVKSAKANLVFDPPWDSSKMSDEAKLALNMF